MSRICKDPLRPLTEQERQLLEQLTHARSEQANVVTWARELLAVASGHLWPSCEWPGGAPTRQSVNWYAVLTGMG